MYSLPVSIRFPVAHPTVRSPTRRGGASASAAAAADGDLSELYLTEIIGEGASGVVLQGMLTTTPVAVRGDEY